MRSRNSLKSGFLFLLPSVIFIGIYLSSLRRDELDRILPMVAGIGSVNCGRFDNIYTSQFNAVSACMGTAYKSNTPFYYRNTKMGRVVFPRHGIMYTLLYKGRTLHNPQGEIEAAFSEDNIKLVQVNGSLLIQTGRHNQSLTVKDILSSKELKSLQNSNY